MTPQEGWSRSQKEDPVTTYLAEHQLEDILTGTTGSQTVDKQTSNSSICNNLERCTSCLRHEKTISTLGTQLKTAAELGQALLVRHQDYVATAENDKAEMRSEILELTERLKLADSESAKISDNNSQLIKQMSIVNDSLFVSEAKVEQLTRTLQDQHSQLTKVNNKATKTEGLESQITMLESAQENLQQECHNAMQEKRLAEARWRKTERMLEKLTVQYEKLEQESMSSDASPRPQDLYTEPVTPIQGFIKNVLQENSSLEHTVTELREKLSFFKEEVKDLRTQLSVHNSRSGFSESTDNQREVHHHHHFHVAPPTLHPKQQATPRLQSRPSPFPYAGLLSGIPTPPESAERISNASNNMYRAQSGNTSPHCYSRHRRTSSLPEAREDDSDTCAGDADDVTDGGYYFDNYSTYGGMERSAIRKFISHESGLRSLGQCEISVVDRLDPAVMMYSDYPGSPTNMVIEEDENEDEQQDLDIHYSPMPQLRRTTSHDSIFSALDVGGLQLQVVPNSPVITAVSASGTLTPTSAASYMHGPDITSSHRPSLYRMSTSSKSEVSTVSAEITFSSGSGSAATYPYHQQLNKIGSKSKMLLSAAVANNINARRRSSLASSFRATDPLASTSTSTGTTGSSTEGNGKWSTFFTKLRGGGGGQPVSSTIPLDQQQHQQEEQEQEGYLRQESQRHHLYQHQQQHQQQHHQYHHHQPQQIDSTAYMKPCTTLHASTLPRSAISTSSVVPVNTFTATTTGGSPLSSTYSSSTQYMNAISRSAGSGGGGGGGTGNGNGNGNGGTRFKAALATDSSYAQQLRGTVSNTSLKHAMVHHFFEPPPPPIFQQVPVCSSAGLMSAPTVVLGTSSSTVGTYTGHVSSNGGGGGGGGDHEESVRTSLKSAQSIKSMKSMKSMISVKSVKSDKSVKSVKSATMSVDHGTGAGAAFEDRAPMLKHLTKQI